MMDEVDEAPSPSGLTGVPILKARNLAPPSSPHRCAVTEWNGSLVVNPRRARGSAGRPCRRGRRFFGHDRILGKRDRHALQGGRGEPRLLQGEGAEGRRGDKRRRGERAPEVQRHLQRVLRDPGHLRDGREVDVHWGGSARRAGHRDSGESGARRGEVALFLGRPCPRRPVPGHVGSATITETGLSLQ